MGPDFEPQSNSKVYSLNYNLSLCEMGLIIPSHSDIMTIQAQRAFGKGVCCGAGGIVGRDNHLPFYPGES